MATEQKMVALALLAIGLLVTGQLGTCEETALVTEPNDDGLYSFRWNCSNGGAASSPTEPSKSNEHLKQSGLWPAFLGWPVRAREKPNIFLIGLKPYQSMLPQQIQDMIDQQIRPQTDDLSAQILSSMPGAEQMYQQVSDFLDMFSQFGPQTFLGGGGGGGSGAGLSSLMGGLGRRR